MAYIPYPQAPNNPNGWQIAGQAVQQVGQAFAEDSDRQAKLRQMMDEMTQRRAAALLAKQESELRQKQLEQETKLKAEADKRAADFAMAAAKGKAISPTLAQDPSLGRRPAASAPLVPGGPTQTELDELGNVDGVLPAQRVRSSQDATALMGEALDRTPTSAEDGRVPLTREEMAQLALEHRQMSPQDYLSATKPAREPLSPAESLELYKAKREIDAAITANKPLTPYQQMMLDVYKDRIEKGDEGLQFRKDEFEHRKGQADANRKTAFVKNTNELKTEIDMFGKLDKEVPGGIYGTGGISGFGFGTAPLRKFWKSDEANRIRPTLQFLVNAILKRQSGAAVSDQEFERLNTAFGINTTGTIEEFRLGLQNYYESARGQYDRFTKADAASASDIDGSSPNLNPSALPPAKTEPPPPARDAKTQKRAEALRRKYNY